MTTRLALVAVIAIAAGGIFFLTRPVPGIRGPGSATLRAGADPAPAEAASGLDRIRARLPEIDSMAESAEKIGLLAKLHADWADLDPKGALDSSLEYPEALTESILRHLAAGDVAAAWKWVEGRTTELDGRIHNWSRYKLVISLLSEAGKYGVAAEFIAGMPFVADVPDNFQSLNAGTLIGLWAKAAPNEAARWSATLSAEAGSRASFALGKTSAPRDIAETMRLLETQSEAAGNNILSGAIGDWVRNGQTSKIVEYVRANRSLSDSRHDKILSSLGYALKTEDPEAMFGLGNEIRDVAARDLFMGNAAAGLRSGNPRLAMNFALAISDPAQRESRAVMVFRDWTTRDARAANDFVSSGNFPPELGRRIIEVAANPAPDPRKAIMDAQIALMTATTRAEQLSRTKNKNSGAVLEAEAALSKAKQDVQNLSQAWGN